MKILLDSNPIYGDYLLEGAPFETLARYLSWTNDELIVPIVVIEESVRHFRKQYEKCLGRISSASNILKIIGTVIDEIPTVDEAVHTYRERLLSRLDELGARLLDLPEVSISDLLQRDLLARRPFDRKGKGFRDTLIWESIVLDCATHEEQVIIISADGDFAQNPRDGDIPTRLHEDLRKDLLDAGFREDRVELIRHIHEFNDLHAKPLVSRVFRKGEPIQDSFAKALKPAYMLERYGEAAARKVHEQLFFILPIGHALADRVSFLRWPEDPELLEVLDLGEGKLQAIVRTRIVFDTDIYGAVETFQRLMEFSKGRPIIVRGVFWDDKNKDYITSLRVAILADFVFHWHPDEDKASAFTLLRFGFTEEEIEQLPMFIY
jgi:hypothetical protein